MNRIARSLPLLAALLPALLVTPKLHAACNRADSLSSLVTNAALVAAAPEPPTSTTDDFTAGTHALDQQRWQDAVTDFDRIISAKGKRTDAALYWKAYALSKLGRGSLAGGTCSQLRRTFPSSTWNRDCAALSPSTANGTGDDGIYAVGNPDPNRGGMLRITPQPNDDNMIVHPPRLSSSNESSSGSDADLKMLALNSVLQRDPNRAIPVIRDILAGNNPPELKHRAISVLAMSNAPEAQSTLRDIATGKLAPTEQKRAIQMLGVFQGKRSGDTLAEIYRNSGDSGVKHAVLSALFVSNNSQQLVDLARNEKDLKLKHDIVAQLALMQDKTATDYMLELLK